MSIPSDVLLSCLNDPSQTLADRAVVAADFTLDKLNTLARIVKEMQRYATPEEAEWLEHRENHPNNDPGRVQILRLKGAVRQQLLPPADVLCAAAKAWGIKAQPLASFVGSPRVHLRTIDATKDVVADIRTEASHRRIQQQHGQEGCEQQRQSAVAQTQDGNGQAKRRPLVGKAKLAAAYIRKHPGCLGEAAALEIPCDAAHFRRIFREKLRPRGFYNVGDGYHPPRKRPRKAAV